MAVTVVALVLFGAGEIHGATFTVTKTADTNDGLCDTDCSLREAILAANALAGPDQVDLPAGTYVLDLVGINENAGLTGDLDVTDDLTLVGAGAGSTVIDGNGTDRVIDVDPSSSGIVASIASVRIQHGYVLTGPAEGGGGIRNHGSLGVTLSTIAENEVEGFAATSVLCVPGFCFAFPSNGGGILNNSVLTITDSTIRGNEARIDGGVWLGDLASFDAMGGGIYNSGSLVIERTTVQGNVVEVQESFCGQPGGGLCNVSALGGGIGSSGSVTLGNSTVSENVARDLGETLGNCGGIRSTGPTSIANSTIAFNAAPFSFLPPGLFMSTGGLCAPNATLQNTIVANNGQVNCNEFETIQADSYNLEFPLNTCGFTGTDVVGIDPRLLPLASNGGVNATHALFGGSPAINGAHPGLPGSGGGACEPTDQRGVTRPQGVRCDIGAYESPCGDGSVDSGEECDDGNGVNEDGCSVACTVEVCGDNVVQSALGEECDDGNNADGDGCNASCLIEFCGDGILQTAIGEECDDGGNVDGNGCNAACIIEICGDGVLQAGLGEECDDGNTAGRDGCSSVCLIEGEFCGDGALQSADGEECDDGNRTNGDGCSKQCIVEFCGDGLQQVGLGEQCDDGNDAAGDGCDAVCRTEFCGDGILQEALGEACDDGNRMSGDGCWADCRVENSPLVVSKTNDSQDGTCDADCSLREAVIAANMTSGPDVITVGPGTYLLTRGALVITSELYIAGAGASASIIDGNGGDRVFRVDGVDAEISKLTVRNGAAPAGAGVWTSRAALTIRECFITANDASLYGGGIYLSSGSLRVLDTTIAGNSCQSTDGGGGIRGNLGTTLEVISSTISGNSNSAVSGGSAIDARGDVTIRGSTITGNTGTIALVLDGPAAQRVLVNSLVADNEIENCFGTITSGGHNLDDDGTCGLMGAGDLNQIGAQIAPLTTSFGETPIHPLCSGPGDPDPACAAASPAINAGSPTRPGTGGGSCEPRDQHGRPRFDRCDIGAYEIGSPPPDPLKCYKVRDLKMPRFSGTTVFLADQFGVNNGIFKVKRPFLLCNPADANDEGVVHPGNHQVCYKVHGPITEAADRPRVIVTDQFGTLTLQIKRAFLLCAPSRKTLLP